MESAIFFQPNENVQHLAFSRGFLPCFPSVPSWDSQRYKLKMLLQNNASHKEFFFSPNAGLRTLKLHGLSELPRRRVHPLTVPAAECRQRAAALSEPPPARACGTCSPIRSGRNHSSALSWSQPKSQDLHLL